MLALSGFEEKIEIMNISSIVGSFRSKTACKSKRSFKDVGGQIAGKKTFSETKNYQIMSGV